MCLTAEVQAQHFCHVHILMEVSLQAGQAMI